LVGSNPSQSHGQHYHKGHGAASAHLHEPPDVLFFNSETFFHRVLTRSTAVRPA
jgi:hypothetical protein